jgi:zinc transport system ATP-binding protein
MKIENLCVKYDKNIVIENFSLNLTLGEKVIIYGPNGTGKTTLLKTILGIVKAASGKIIFEDDEVIAYCKQDYPNPEFPITVEEVVAMGLFTKKITSKKSAKNDKNNGEKIDEALKKADALNLKGRLFYSLSGGERQKVSLARCYCQNAKILLLDEPSSFLDVQSKKTFINQMKKLEQEDFSVIAVTVLLHVKHSTILYPSVVQETLTSSKIAPE